MEKVTDNYEQGQVQEQEQEQTRRKNQEENCSNDDDDEGGGGDVKKKGNSKNEDSKQEEERKNEEEESKQEENEKQAKQQDEELSSDKNMQTVVLTTTTTTSNENENTAEYNPNQQQQQQPYSTPQQQQTSTTTVESSLDVSHTTSDGQQENQTSVLLKQEEKENVDTNENKKESMDLEEQRTFDEVVEIHSNDDEVEEEEDSEDNDDEGDEETGHPDEEQDNDDDYHDRKNNKNDYVNDGKNSDDGSYETNKKKDGDDNNVTPTEIARHGSSRAVIKRRKAGGSDKQPTTFSHTTIDGQQYELVTAAKTVSKQSIRSSSSSSIRRLSWTRVLLFLFCFDCCVILPLYNIYLAWKQVTYHIPESTLAKTTTTPTKTTTKEATEKAAAAASIHEADAADASSYGLWNKIDLSFLLKGLSRSSSSNEQSKNKQRIAVFISGAQLQHFLLQSTVERFLKPLVEQGHAVDFYFSFFMVQSYSPTMTHLDEIASYASAADATRLPLEERVHWDPWLTNYTILTNIASKSKKFQTLMERRIRQSLIRQGALVRHIMFNDNDAEVLDNNNNKVNMHNQINAEIDLKLQHDTRLKRHRRAAVHVNEKEDPDLRFPLNVPSIKVEVKKATIHNNRQLLRTAYARLELWNILKQVEQTLAPHPGSTTSDAADETKKGKSSSSSASSTRRTAQGAYYYYDYVVFLKENTFWLQDFDFNKVVLKPQQQREEKNMKPFDAFALNCDTVGAHNDEGHSWSTASPLELSDAILIMKRSNAEYYGDYYSELFLDNYNNCTAALAAAGDRRGLCTEAMLLHYNLVNHRKLNVQFLNSAHLPIQRALNIVVKEEEDESNNSTAKKQQPQQPKAHLKLKGSVLTLQTCLHEVCQSREEPLDLYGYATCK